eukprot:1426590-Rhodomonas_salina.2
MARPGGKESMRGTESVSDTAYICSMCVSGTDIAYRAQTNTRRRVSSVHDSPLTRHAPLPAYARATQCPVLT